MQARRAPWGLFFVVAAVGACGPAREADVKKTPPVEAASKVESTVEHDSAWLDAVGSRILAGEYRFRAVDGAFQATNAFQGIGARFDQHGVAFHSRVGKGKEVTLKLRSWGRAGALTPATPAVPALGACSGGDRVDEEGACLRRLELARGGGLVEWWENRDGGMEQGFTVAQRAPGEKKLRFEIAVGAERVRVNADGTGAKFDSKGFELDYSYLSTVDAGGRSLPSRMVAVAGGLAIEVDDRGAQYPIVIDPVVFNATWSVESNQSDAQFGFSSASAGDVNGDGFSDAIVGAPFFDNQQQDEGRAFLFLGSMTGLATTAAWTTESDQINAQLGTSVASAGDVNGDGYSDVIVGTPYWDITSGTDEGRAQVFLGSSSGLATTAAWTVNGDQANARFGHSVASAGDVNGDAFSDVIVGTPFYDGGQTDEGRAQIFLGSGGGLATSAQWTKESDQASSQYGLTVASAGDTNGDGYSDVIVGAPRYDNGQTDEGAAFAYLGSASGVSTSYVWTGESNQANWTYGTSVASAGDVNGDGYSDILIGAPNSTASGAHIHYGSSTGPVAVASWSEFFGTSARFGQTVASAGDLNGDGYGDIVIAEPQRNNPPSAFGGFYVFFGSPTGPAAVANFTRLADANTWGPFGGSVACAGDVNGDGFADLVIGNPGFQGGQTGEGRVQIFSGAGSALRTASSWGVSGGQASARLGWSLSGAGDVNGDGFADVVVGAPRYANGQALEGRALVYPGSASGLSTTALWSYESDQAGAELGSSVAGAGDVNGDGYADIAVGASLFDDGEADEGVAYLFLGSATGPGASPVWSTFGGAVNAKLGQVVAGAGDVNGDGFADLAVAALDNVRVFTGSALGLSTSAASTLVGDQAGSSFGSALASAGDVNGDGYGDLIVGAPAYDAGQTDEGRAFAYHGSSSGLATSAAWTIESNTASGGLGASVSTAGDINADGYSDVLVGSRTATTGTFAAYLGSSSGVSTTANWTNALGTTGAGIVVSTSGDVNGDGYSDIAIGLPVFGGTYWYQGSSSGVVTVPFTSLTAPGGTSAFGTAVAHVGDVNGDGFSDLAVGAPNYGTSLAQEGRVSIWAGNAADMAVPIGMGWGPRRSGSTTPIASGGNAPGSAFDGRVAKGRTPFGRGRTKLAMEAKPFGTAFDNAGLLVGGNFVDSGLTGVEIDTGVAGLTANSAYRFRMRVTYDPSLGLPQLAGPWFYGGALEHRRGVHVRTQCASGDDDSDGTPNCNDGCPNDPNKLVPGVCGCGSSEADGDGDGTPNCNDLCPSNAGKIAPGVCGCAVADTDNDGDGTPNCNDSCPNNAPKTSPGVCGCAVADTDNDGDGTPNCNDNCPNNAPKTAPGVCGCAVADTDSDGDGTPNCNDNCPADPAKTSPGFCGCGVSDADSDGDGTRDCLDGCPNDASKITAGTCGCGVPDTDSDGDGTPNCNDGCPNDSSKIAPGVCGCGVPDTDSDGDGTKNCNDGCPNDSSKIAPGVCGCGVPDTDSDGDGTKNCNDGCPNDANKITPGVCGCGVPDTDSDGDGTKNCNDGCPNDASKITAGICGCGVPDTDSDGDGTANCNDGCPSDPLKVSTGVCGCGVSDADGDGDGTPNCNDNCPTDPLKTVPGVCGCGVSDADSDGDGTRNCNDGCPNDPSKIAPGVCGCGVSDIDSDGDGTRNCNDGCPNDANKITPGVCGCGVADTDSDGDGTRKCNDGCPNDAQKTAPGACGCGTPDTDGDSDGTPNCDDDCPSDPVKITPGVCGCGVSDSDSDGDGTRNCNDQCPSDPQKTSPGDCGCGTPDVDDDNDGEPDCADTCPTDPNKSSPGLCGCGTPDTDTDADGTANCTDQCPSDPGKIAPGACGCGDSDLDTDGDGSANCVDGCPSDATKLTPGECGCGTADDDTDGDGTLDCSDDCAGDADKVTAGLCGCGTADTDSDADGTPDCDDACAMDPNKLVAGTCGCGVADGDADGDGTLDCNDACPEEAGTMSDGCPTQGGGEGGAGGEGGETGSAANGGRGGSVGVTGGTGTGGSGGRGATGGRGGSTSTGGTTGDAGANDPGSAGESGESSGGAAEGGEAGAPMAGTSGKAGAGGSGHSGSSGGCGCRVGAKPNDFGARALSLIGIAILLARRLRRRENG